MEETMVLLNSLVEAPDDFGSHIRRLATMTTFRARQLIVSIRNAVAAILKIAYGVQVAGNDDPLVLTLEDNFRRSAQVFSNIQVFFLPISVLSLIYFYSLSK